MGAVVIGGEKQRRLTSIVDEHVVGGCRASKSAQHQPSLLRKIAIEQALNVPLAHSLSPHMQEAHGERYRKGCSSLQDILGELGGNLTFLFVYDDVCLRRLLDQLCRHVKSPVRLTTECVTLAN